MATAAMAQTTLVSCPTSGVGIDRGFYVSNYGGVTLNQVTVVYLPNTAGTYTMSLTARLNAYDGTLLGTQNQTVAISGATNVTYDFGGVAVPSGSTIAFSQAIVSGPDTTMFYDAGPCAFFPTACSSCPGVVETNDTTPPLSTDRRPSVAVTITGTAAAPTAVPLFSPAVLLALAAMLAADGMWILGRRI